MHPLFLDIPNLETLFLNVSDLKDHEAALFTSCLLEFVPPHHQNICDLANYEVPLFIARGLFFTWLRSRYPDFPENGLDKILGAFPASSGQKATINGGQYFAVFRLILDACGPKRVGPEKTRDITPNNNSLPIEVINNLISKERKSLREMIVQFLKDPELPIWDPPEYASDREYLASLQLPTYPDGGPCLLLHNLNECDPDEVKVFRGVHPLCICNTSGSGKTRHMLKVLTKIWGFYLVATPDDNSVGIPDLQDAMDGVKEYSEWVTDLGSIPSQDWAGQSDINSQIASKLLKKVLAARIVIFELFLELAIEVDGRLQHKHKRIWLLFQLFDRVYPSNNPFILIKNNCLKHASAGALGELLKRLAVISETYFPKEDFILGLDEAQHAVRSYPRSFVSSLDNTVYRSFLHEMVKVFTKLPAKLVVSGTGVPIGDLNVALASGVSKSGQKITWYHDLGMFDVWPKLASGKTSPASER